MINRKTAQILLLIVLVLVPLSMMLPAVSGCVELERESGMFIFHGYNFAEVSLFGVLTILLNIVAIVITLTKIRFKLKCIAISILNFLECGSYIAGYLITRQALFDTKATQIHDEYGFYVSIVLYASAIALSIIFLSVTTKKQPDHPKTSNDVI